MAIVVVACVANYFLFIPAAVIVGAQLLFRWFFLHTSRHIKRLEALGKLTCVVCICRINDDLYYIFEFNRIGNEN